MGALPATRTQPLPQAVTESSSIQSGMDAVTAPYTESPRSAARAPSLAASRTCEAAIIAAIP